MTILTLISSKINLTSNLFVHWICSLALSRCLWKKAAGKQQSQAFWKRLEAGKVCNLLSLAWTEGPISIYLRCLQEQSSCQKQNTHEFKLFHQWVWGHQCHSNGKPHFTKHHWTHSAAKRNGCTVSPGPVHVDPSGSVQPHWPQDVPTMLPFAPLEGGEEPGLVLAVCSWVGMLMELPVQS